MSQFSVDTIRRAAVRRPTALRNAARIFPASFLDVAKPESGTTGVGRKPSRFTDDKKPPSYGVLYTAANPVTAVYEAVIRDNYTDPSYRVPRIELEKLQLAFLASEPLTLVEVSSTTAPLIRLHRNAHGGDQHGHAQRFSAFVHAHMGDVDGFLYPSTLRRGDCVAVFERSTAKLSCTTTYTLDRSPSVMTELKHRGYTR